MQVFLTQLEERKWPRFPQSAWFAALRFADREAEYVHPLNGAPLVSQKVCSAKGERLKNFDFKTQALVRTACDRWGNQYGT